MIKKERCLFYHRVVLDAPLIADVKVVRTHLVERMVSVPSHAPFLAASFVSSKSLSLFSFYLSTVYGSNQTKITLLAI